MLDSSSDITAEFTLRKCQVFALIFNFQACLYWFLKACLFKIVNDFERCSCQIHVSMGFYDGLPWQFSQEFQYSLTQPFIEPALFRNFRAKMEAFFENVKHLFVCLV